MHRATHYSFRRHAIGGISLFLGLIILLYRFFVAETYNPGERTLWVLDTSLSMLVEDISTEKNALLMSRLDLAKKIISEGRKNIAGEHALITYARDASVESPFSSDITFFENTLFSISSVGAYGGSDMQSAFSLIKSLYGTMSAPMNIIILTDGGTTNTSPSVLLPSNFHISFIGIGSLIGGKILLGYNADGERRYKYYSGEELVVRYEEGLLQKIASNYDARLFHFRFSTDTFPENLIEKPLEKEEKDILLIISSILICFGYFYHPYVSKSE